ncbi:signal-induced proliferation-associated 1-like protein 2 isoform X2 [Leuresthes tenuis]|uniref:signal-induced proliferation-associated 1-like protein 2 isoform X2 n=1 Tax=Leuresthes tenuis TaxID=355514 RepID=UPI003B51475A
MGPPLIQGAPVVPKMGVQACVSNWSRKRNIWDVQPPPRYDSLVPSFLSDHPPSDRLLEKSMDLQTRLETRFQLLDVLSPSRSLVRMKRSNSEVTISDIGTEDLDPDAINPNTGATLRRGYGSTSTLDRQSSFMKALRMEQEPSTPLPLPEPKVFHTSLSPSLQAASKIACGDVVYIQGCDYMESSVYSRDQGSSHVQRINAETSILGRLRTPRSERDLMQQQDTSFPLTPHKCFSHYDVQSVLFSVHCSTPPQTDRHRPPQTACSGEARCPDGAESDAVGDDADRRFSSLLLSCPLFLNEIGGVPDTRLDLNQACSAAAHGFCSEVPRATNATVSVLEACRETQVFSQKLMRNYDIEHIDLGAKYYLKYFYKRDHQNYFGVDKNFGPVSLSIQREQLEDSSSEMKFSYRIILRTGQRSTLRGSILEDCIPSSSKHGTSRGLPLRDVLEFVVPELNIQSLRLASSSPRVPELLLQLDQQELSLQYRVGLLFCRTEQTTEDHMYNNKTSSPALDQFLDLMGLEVPLTDFNTNSAQLDTTVYTTFGDFKLMFHVLALLPYTTRDPTQLQQKNLIGNNIVTVIFQEPDAPPFNLGNIRSPFQHVFIVVRVHRPCSQHTCYSVVASRRRGVPSFGPPIPPGWMFPASPTFRDFLLTKVINAENAVRCSELYVAMATQYRQEQLSQLVETFITSTAVESSLSAKFSFVSLGVKKKERSAPQPHAYLQSAGALTWSVATRDPSSSTAIACRLAISNELVVLMEEASRQVVFSCLCRDVIGWSAGYGTIKLFYLHGHSVMFSTRDGRWEDVKEISQRLQMVTCGGPAMDVNLQRNRLGQLGFHVNFEGVVADVEAHGFAWQAGLRPGCRLMEICSVPMVTLSHEQMIELLRTSATVSVLVLPPNRDGTPRRSFSEMYRVPKFHFKLDSDVTSSSYRVLPPTWHQVSAAPPTPRTLSNQTARSELHHQRGPVRRSSSSDLWGGRSSPNQSTSSDAGPVVTRQIPCRALLDQSISCDESPESTQERTNRTGCEGARYLHHLHHTTNVIRQNVMDAESNDTMLRFAGKSCSSCCNSLSSNSSEDRHTGVVSLDSGIDSVRCTSLAPPTVALATLALRDMRGGGHVTDLSGTCSLSRHSSEGRLKISSPANSPEAFITYACGSTLEAGFTHSQEKCLQDRDGLSRSERGPLREKANRVRCHPIRDVFVRKNQSDVTKTFISRVLASSPWGSLTRTMSNDSLCRSLSLTSSRRTLHTSDQRPPHHRSMPLPSASGKPMKSELCSSAVKSTMTGHRQMPLPQVSPHLDLCHLVEAARTCRGVCSWSSLCDISQLHELEVASQSSALQDSDITTSLSGKVFQLEEILHQLQLDLLKEQQDKAALQQQVLSLRQDNLRLQEESRSATEQIGRFTAWMLRRGMLP